MYIDEAGNMIAVYVLLAVDMKLTLSLKSN